MAEVDNKIGKEITGQIGLQVMRAQATGASSTFTSRFGVIDSFSVYDETTATPATATKSAGALTITATNDDYLDIWVWGR